MAHSGCISSGRTARPHLEFLRACSTISVAVLVACGGGDGPTDTPDGPASITIVSAADTVIATGSTAQLTATAKNAAGGVVNGVTFTWSSSNTGVASVSQSGSVNGVTAGTATITAASGNTTGTLLLRVIAPDLAGVSALLNDPYRSAVTAALTPSTATQVQSALGGCSSGLSGGNLVAIHTCLTTLQSITGSGSGDDTALLPVLNLFWDLSRTRLAFGR
jgi:hypothetical protein